LFTLKTKIDIASNEFKSNKKEFEKLLKQFRGRMENSTRGGSERAINKHKERGKLLARDRINLLVDPNTPFLELSSLAAFGQRPAQITNPQTNTVQIRHQPESRCLAFSQINFDAPRPGPRDAALRQADAKFIYELL
jgi:hypothetical protein